MLSLKNKIQIEMNKAREKIKKIDEGKLNSETKERKIQEIVKAYIHRVKNLENEFAKTKRNHKNKTKNFTK